MKILNIIVAVLALAVCILFVLIGVGVMHDYSQAVGYVLTALLIGQPIFTLLVCVINIFHKRGGK